MIEDLDPLPQLKIGPLVFIIQKNFFHTQMLMH
jgi:hypothetical protein